MDSSQWMIYGANGFSGSLIAREAVRCKLKPILAGRDRKAITDLSRELGLEYRIFGIDELHDLKGIQLFLNCAGPFKATTQTLAESCLARGVHYLDISGELPTFQKLFELSNLAIEKHSILLPGVGFFITATDCLLNLLKRELPDAESIDLFFVVDSQFRFNNGSKKSILELFNQTQTQIEQERKNSSFSVSKKIIIEGQEINSIYLALPDLFTGKISVSIPNVRIYGHFRNLSFLFNKAPWLLINSIAYIGNSSGLKALIDKAIDIFPSPRVDIGTMNSGVLLHGVASNKAGVLIKKTFKLGNPYTFTQKSSVIGIKRILDNQSLAYSGFQTPGSFFGENFLLEIVEEMERG